MPANGSRFIFDTADAQAAPRYVWCSGTIVTPDPTQQAPDIPSKAPVSYDLCIFASSQISPSLQDYIDIYCNTPSPIVSQTFTKYDPTSAPHKPSSAPTYPIPTPYPTMDPTNHPTTDPTISSLSPTISSLTPTNNPTANPNTAIPTTNPTTFPSISPTRFPTSNINIIYHVFVEIVYQIHNLSTDNILIFEDNTIKTINSVVEILEKHYFDIEDS
eukprot:500027_1